MGRFEKLSELVQEHLDPGEQIVAKVMGAYKRDSVGQKVTETGILVATEYRVVLFGKRLFGHDFHVFPYSKISSIDSGKKLLGRYIEIFASGNKLELYWINNGDVDEFFSYVQSKIGPSSGQSGTKVSIADEIEKLAGLVAKGILTQAEFDKKKAELLSRI